MRFDFLLVLIGLLIIFCIPADKKSSNYYTFTVDGSDSVLRYTIYDDDKVIGIVRSGELDSLIIKDNL